MADLREMAARIVRRWRLEHEGRLPSVPEVVGAMVAHGQADRVHAETAALCAVRETQRELDQRRRQGVQPTDVGHHAMVTG